MAEFARVRSVHGGMDKLMRTCDVCKQEREIVVICMIGCHLCASCQKVQNRISHQEMHADLERELRRAEMEDFQTLRQA